MRKEVEERGKVCVKRKSKRKRKEEGRRVRVTRKEDGGRMKEEG